MQKPDNTVKSSVEFDASERLDWALKNFMNPEARRRLGSQVLRLRTVYQRAYPMIGSTMLAKDADAEQIDRNRDSLERWYQHEFHFHSHYSLGPPSPTQEGFRFNFILKTNSREQMAIVREPSFSPEYNSPLHVYAQFSVQDLLPVRGINIARNALIRHMGMTRVVNRDDEGNVTGHAVYSNPNGAPWDIHLTHPRVHLLYPYENTGGNTIDTQGSNVA